MGILRLASSDERGWQINKNRINNFGMVIELFDFCNLLKTIKNGKKSVEEKERKLRKNEGIRS